MAFVLLTILKQICQRYQTYRRINRFERIKLNAIRRKYRLPSIYTTCDWIWDIICFPFNLVFGTIYDLFERIVTSIGSRGRRRRIPGHMRRPFKKLTDENKLLRKILYFLFGISISYMIFLFLYTQHLMNNYYLIGTTIGVTVVFALIAPFNKAIMCLTLIGLPSMFSSKVRYVLVAYVMYALYFQVFPNIWNNGRDGIDSFGCSVWQTGSGGKKMASLLVEDIREFVRNMKQKVRDIIKRLKVYLKAFDLGIKMPNLNLKALCNEPTDEDTYKCEDKISVGSVDGHRFYPPFVCTLLWEGFAGLCQTTKEGMKAMYNEAKRELLELIEKLERELYFDVELNDDFDYHYNRSNPFNEAFKRVGYKFMEKHWLLAYLPYLFNIKHLFLVMFTLWIIIISIIYRFRYLMSDAFDNTYINEELLKIDKKRAEFGRETVLPLNMYERRRFIYPFDPMMTSIEFNRFMLGLAVMTVTLVQIVIYFVVDISVYNLIYWYNTFIDVMSDIFAPASVRLDFSGDSFIAQKLNSLNNRFDVKQRIVEQIQSCKSIPLPPDRQLYNKILILLAVILLTVFSSSYGLRLRHYFAGLFYPHREPIRAVWLYNNILCRRGNLFQFWRKKVRQQVYGKKATEEGVSVLDRLCAQSTIIRIVCKVLGLYGKHKYCQICGLKVKIDGSDQSVRCGNNCGAIYCFDCLGEQNNICAVCMKTIDFADFSDFSEELDSSEDEF